MTQITPFTAVPNRGMSQETLVDTTNTFFSEVNGFVGQANALIEDINTAAEGSVFSAPDWVAQEYDAHKTVIYTDHNVYISTESTLATDVPSVSAKWTKITINALELASKAPIASPTFTGTVTLPSTTSIGTVSNAELSYLDGVTSSIQTQLNNKQATLVSGTNIKTVGGTSLLGSGDISVSGNVVLLSTVTASLAASADIEWSSSAVYKSYLIICDIENANSSELKAYMKLGFYLTTDTNYFASYFTAAQPQAISATQAPLICSSMYYPSFNIDVFNPDSGNFKGIRATGVGFDATLQNAKMIESAIVNTTSNSVLTGIRIKYSSGSISGVFKLYGIKA